MKCNRKTKESSTMLCDHKLKLQSVCANCDGKTNEILRIKDESSKNNGESNEALRLLLHLDQMNESTYI